MGKLTMKQAEEMLESGLLTKDKMKEWQDSGLISSRQRGKKWYMKSKDNKIVFPQLYFQGLGKGGQYSPNMSNLRDEFNKLIHKYAKKEK